MQDRNPRDAQHPGLSIASGTSPRARRRRALLYGAAAIGVFPAGIAVDRFLPLPGSSHLLLPVAGFAGYLIFGSKALAAGFPGLERRWSSRRWTLRLGIAAGMWLAPARTVLAQQTIFNVPTADVLDAGKTYFENDNLWRAWDPKSAAFALRGVVGLGFGVEAGANVGGVVTPGRSIPTVTAAVKWRPIQLGRFAITSGVQGLFYIRGAADGKPSVHVYTHGSYRLPGAETRVTAGGWFASSGYASPRRARGALFGLEQPAGTHLSVIADMYSGKSSLGYATFGIEPTFGPWTMYAGYSVRNGNSKGNALLIEVGANP